MAAFADAGLPVMFDREFGFLNRLPIYIVTLSLIQAAVIVTAGAFLGAGLPDVLLLVLGVRGLSLGLAFALPGHIELIAVIFVTNLPLLFASTAEAPYPSCPTGCKSWPVSIP